MVYFDLWLEGFLGLRLIREYYKVKMGSLTQKNREKASPACMLRKRGGLNTSLKRKCALKMLKETL